jgi:mannose-6-phosphate isomerase-like protein (cupin superfamily)
MKPSKALSLAAMLSCTVTATHGQVVATPAGRDAVFVSKEDLAAAVATKLPPGMTLASLGAVRAGNDRIGVDEIKRLDAAAEGPVSHSVVTEIYYVIEGGGTMETGGTILDPAPMLTNGKPTNPANIGPSVRGTKMSGGTTRAVKAGDVIMIPPGVPHRFVGLDGFVTYMVVRVNPGYEKGR